MISVDQACVCAIDTKFECSVEKHTANEDISFCVKTEMLYSLISEIDSKSVLTMEIQDNKMLLLGEDETGNKQRFYINLIDTDDDQLSRAQLHNIVSHIEVELNCKRLKSFIALVNKIKGTDVTFRVARVKNKLTFVGSAKGDEGSAVEIQFQSHHIQQIEKKCHISLVI